MGEQQTSIFVFFFQLEVNFGCFSMFDCLGIQITFSIFENVRTFYTFRHKEGINNLCQILRRIHECQGTSSESQFV